jgi:histidinol-phosphatase (PHP family)
MSLASSLFPSLKEVHCHTPFCHHAIGEPFEYAEKAASRGLAGIIFTDHIPLPEGYSPNVRMAIDELDAYLTLIAGVKQQFKGIVEVDVGLESDFLPGLEPWLKEVHARADFRHIIGSVHPQTPEYQKYCTGDAFEDQKIYFDLVAQSAESGLFDTLGHCDLIKNETVGKWDIERIFPFVCSALDRIAETGVAIELNTSGVNKADPEINPGPEILLAIKERGIPVVLGADAHRPERVGDGFSFALELLSSLGFDAVYRPEGRERVKVPLQKF